MAVSNGHTEPTERSPLLAKDPSTDAVAASNGKSADASPPRPDQCAADDEEVAGGAGQEEPDNPMFEGLPEVAAKLHILVPAVAIGIFLAAADQTIIVSTYGKIGSELHALNSTSWIATAYFLTLTTCQPLYGKLSDIFGRKPTLLFAYTVFGLGCLLCGLARSMPELIGARALAGVGGGGMTTVTSIMFSDIIPLRKRGTWQGYINVVFASGAAIGAPLGGVFADSVGWRWLFLAQAPLCLVAFAVVYFVLDLPAPEDSTWRVKLKQIDFLGALTLVAATSTLLVGLDRGSNTGWSNPLALSCLLTSLPLFVLFLCVEMFWAANPFAPGHIILERSLFAAYLCNFFSVGGYMSTLFYIPLFFQAVDGVTAFQAGVRLIPGIVVSVLGSVGGGLIMQRTGRYYWLTVWAFACLVVGTLIVSLFSSPAAHHTWGIIAGMCVCGLGGGTGVTTTLIALISNAAPRDQAIATACSYLFRSLGSVIGLSLSATLVQTLLRTLLRQRLDASDPGRADAIAEGVRQSLDFIDGLDADTRAVVRSCYQRATGGAFALTAVFTLAALVSSFWIREKRLSK